MPITTKSDLLAPECEYCGSHENLSDRCDEEPQCNLCGRGGHRSKNCTACPICNAFTRRINVPQSVITAVTTVTVQPTAR